jgi:hypothetical protein
MSFLVRREIVKESTSYIWALRKVTVISVLTELCYSVLEELKKVYCSTQTSKTLSKMTLAEGQADRPELGIIVLTLYRRSADRFI